MLLSHLYIQKGQQVTIETILTFTTISILLVISPGPNGVLFLKTVPLYGKKNAMSNLLGIFTATYVHGALSFFGLSAIILSSANLFMLIEMSFIFKKNIDIKTRKNQYWLAIQVFVNILGIIVSFFAYKYKYR